MEAEPGVKEIYPYVITHPSRRESADRLQKALMAGLCIDQSGIGCDENHMRIWRHYAETLRSGWLLVVEDDALPGEDFVQRLSEVIERWPDHLISLYLGKVYPPQYQLKVQNMLFRARQKGSDHIALSALLHGVGYVLPVERIPAMLPLLENSFRPIDERIGKAWRDTAGTKVIYPIPSLVDHDETLPSLVHERRPGRKAWVPPAKLMNLDE